MNGVSSKSSSPTGFLPQWAQPGWVQAGEAHIVAKATETRGCCHLPVFLPVLGLAVQVLAPAVPSDPLLLYRPQDYPSWGRLQKPTCPSPGSQLAPAPAPQPTDHGRGSLHVRDERGLPVGCWRSSGRARTHNSQIPDLAPGRRAWSSPVAGVGSSARSGLGLGGAMGGHQMGMATLGAKAGTPLLRGPGHGPLLSFL